MLFIGLPKVHVKRVGRLVHWIIIKSSYLKYTLMKIGIEIVLSYYPPSKGKDPPLKRYQPFKKKKERTDEIETV